MEEHESAPLLLQLPQKAAGEKPQASGVISLVARSDARQHGQEVGGPVPAVSPPLPAAPGTPWGVTTCLLLADMFGIGSLSLPGVFARLGWLVSFLALFAFSMGCGYLGVLFARLGTAVPNAQAFDEIGSAAMRTRGAQLVYGLVYTTIFVDPIVLQLTCVLSLQRILPSLSSLAAGGIVALIMLPLAQIQSIHDVGFLSILATASMVLAAGIVLVKMLAMPGSKLSETSLLPPSSTGHVAFLTALMNMVFAYGGEVNWMRYESAMKKRLDFKYAVEVADMLMSIFYILIAVVGYLKLGTNFDFTKPVTSVLPRDAWVVVMNLFLLIRCIVAYLLNINIWIDMILRVGKRWTGVLEQTHPRFGQKLLWATASCVGIAFSFLVAWGVPFFSTILALIAAIGSVAAPYTLPALFALAILKDIHTWERWLLRTLVPVSALCAVAGVYAAIAEVVLLFGSKESRA